MAQVSKMRNIVLRFDMRSSPGCPESPAERYRQAIEMACWADNNEVDVVGLSEHHNTEDGFLSAPLALAAMMAARTERVRLSVSALLVPLHDPLRLAEDIALLDLVSRGRFSVTCGLGYREIEYDCFGVDWKQRGRVFDEKLAVLVAALSGETIARGSTQARLNPTPSSPLLALLQVGGNSVAAARRAARFGLLFCPAIDDPKLEQAYLDACAEHGNAKGMTIFPREPATTFISENPADTWAEIGEYLLYDAVAYSSWQHASRRAYAESSATDLETLKGEGKYRVLTPAQAIDVINDSGSLHLAPLTGGVPSAVGWRSLELFERAVQPHIRG